MEVVPKHKAPSIAFLLYLYGTSYQSINQARVTSATGVSHDWAIDPDDLSDRVRPRHA